MSSDAQALLPRHKLDLERAEAIVQLGYPAVHPVLPDLFQWLQDMNWPVAQIIAPFLVTIGEPILPEVRYVLNTSDVIWKYWVLLCVVKELPVMLAAKLQPDIQRILDTHTPNDQAEGVAEIARDIFNTIDRYTSL